jgi:hypothetical protein
MQIPSQRLNAGFVEKKGVKIFDYALHTCFGDSQASQP